MSNKKDEYEVPTVTGHFTIAPMQGQGYAYTFQDPTAQLPGSYKAHFTRLLEEKGIDWLRAEAEEVGKALSGTEEELGKQRDTIARLKKERDENDDRWTRSYDENIAQVEKHRRETKAQRGKIRPLDEALQAFLREQAPLKVEEPAGAEEKEAQGELAALNNQLGAAHNLIKAQKGIIKALRRRDGKPDSEEMKAVMDENRHASSERVNYAAVARTFGCSDKTAKKWIQELGLSSYAKGS